jgi:hypothetical protein
MPKGMQPIYTRVFSAGVGAVSLNNIPQTYTDLKVVVSQRNGTSSNVAENLAIRFDDSNTVYSNTVMYGSGSGVASSRSSANGFISYTTGLFINGGTSTANTFAQYEVYIPNYTSNIFKQFTIDAVTENNATEAYASLSAGLYRNISPITKVFVQGYSVSASDNTTVTIYGIAK